MAILDNPQENLSTDGLSIMPTAQKWGLYFGAASIILTIVMSLIGFDFDKPMTFMIYSLTIALAFLGIFLGFGIATIREHRTNLGGFIDFKTAFMVAFVAFAIGMVISSVFGFVYNNYINPSYIDGMKESMVNMFEKLNAPESQQSETLQALDDQKTIGGTAKAALKSIAGSAVLAAIMGAIMKKEKPMFG
jgi:hypothetical protein